MRFLIVILVFLAWALVGLANPAYAAGLLLWVDISAPLELAYSTGAIPISMMALGALAVSFAINTLFRGHRPIFTFYFWMWLLFMGWAALSAHRSPFPVIAWDGWIMTLKYLGPLAIVSLCVRGIREVKFLAAVLALSLGIWGVQLGIGCIKNGVNSYMHIEGTQMGDNNFLAAGLVATLPVLLFFVKEYDWKFRKAVRIALLAVLALCLITIIFSNSRGAALGVVGNVIIYLTLISRRKVRDFAIAIALGGVVALLLPASFYERMGTLGAVGTEKSDSSAKERMHLASSTVRAIGDFAVTGVGPYCWTEISTSYTGLAVAMQPHSIWLKVAVELGLPGAGLFFGLIFGTIVRLLWVRKAALRRGEAKFAALALALASSLIGYTVSMTFLSNYDLEYQWAWMAVGNGLVGVWKKKSRMRKRPAAAPRREEAPPDADAEAPGAGLAGA